MDSWGHNLLYVLEQFTAKCEDNGMTVSSFRFEAMVLNWKKKMENFLWTESESLHQVEKFQYLRIFCSRIIAGWSWKLFKK